MLSSGLPILGISLVVVEAWCGSGSCPQENPLLVLPAPEPRLGPTAASAATHSFTTTMPARREAWELEDKSPECLSVLLSNLQPTVGTLVTQISGALRNRQGGG